MNGIYLWWCSDRTDTLHENILVNCLTIYVDRPMVKLFTSESDMYFYIFVKFFASLQQDSGEEKYSVSIHRGFTLVT